MRKTLAIVTAVLTLGIALAHGHADARDLKPFVVYGGSLPVKGPLPDFTGTIDLQSSAIAKVTITNQAYTASSTKPLLFVLQGSWNAPYCSVTGVRYVTASITPPAGGATTTVYLPLPGNGENFGCWGPGATFALFVDAYLDAAQASIITTGTPTFLEKSETNNADYWYPGMY